MYNLNANLIYPIKNGENDILVNNIDSKKPSSQNKMTLLEKVDLNNDVHLSIDKSCQVSPKVKINTKNREPIDTEPVFRKFSNNLKMEFSENDFTNGIKNDPETRLSNNIPSLRLENKSLDFFNNTYDSRDFSSKRLCLRCYSEPPSTQFNKNLIYHSPTIRLLFKNMKKQSSINMGSKIHLFSSTQSIANEEKSSQFDTNPNKKLVKFSVEDFLSIFSLKQLAFKRSFSSTKLKIEKKLIKKSPSFKNFLKNVLKGKQKSNSMCNFNGILKSQENYMLSELALKSSRRASTNYSFKEHTVSGGSTNSLDKMMMLILNNTTWPVLKIDDSLRNSMAELEPNQKVEKYEQQSNKLSAFDTCHANTQFSNVPNYENKNETENIDKSSKNNFYAWV